MLLNIESKTESAIPPVLRLGFRPFFLLAGVFGVIAMMHWMLVFSYGQSGLYPGWISPFSWHAHEMLFGYAFAVIVGFLLTAVRNWTNIQTINGTKLAILAGIWLLGRTLAYIPELPLIVIAVVDVSFLALAAVALIVPLYRGRQYKQYGIVAKLILMVIFHVLFYLGVAGIVEQGIHIGLYGSFYSVLGLVFVMARRLVPFFVEKGLRLQTPIKNHALLDYASLVLFLIYAVLDLFYIASLWMAVVALTLFAIHLVRVVWWYKNTVWSSPLLWVLLFAYAMLTLAFALKAGSVLFNWSPYLAIHAFSVGGIGVLTLGMMARVSLGHTGRDVFNPPPILHVLFALIAASAIFRVIFPLLLVNQYKLWILISQGLWMLAFVAFVMIYAPYFMQARIDGRFG